ncbi:MAG: hypothetical protein M3378_08400, partial [Actinomycetota bacterium]|nr:hypothetical protein [Actinomycetota bacterium]MDQ3680545.1 hypothetical protein [Actinomycetota bacterium]
MDTARRGPEGERPGEPPAPASDGDHPDELGLTSFQRHVLRKAGAVVGGARARLASALQSVRGG